MSLPASLRTILSRALLGPVRLWRRLRLRRQRPHASRRILVPFTRGHLEPTVLDAALRIARAEDAVLVPAYLILVPLQFALDTPLAKESALALPLLDAVEYAASRAGIAVDSRVESGRTPIHALERLWSAESFDRIVVPAPSGREPGFTPKELLWVLTNAPSETVILRPNPGSRPAPTRVERGDRFRPGLPSVALPAGALTEAPTPRIAATKSV